MIPLFGILLALGFIGALIFGVPAFFWWVAREHHLASKYRQLVRMVEAEQKTEPVESGPAWTVTYRRGRKRSSVVVYGVDESDMFRKFIKDYGPATILSSVKVGS